MTTPLLKVGSFGTHIIHNPAKTYSFVGTVPFELDKSISQTYDQAVQVFIDWYKRQDQEFQDNNFKNLRQDIKSLIKA
jgi:delta 1-pyrroline-5-carboxylate dehydrogenase